MIDKKDFDKIDWEAVKDPDEGNQEDGETWDYREKKSGDTLMGIYKGVKLNLGPNNSKLYTFETENGLEKVWGSYVLDRRMSTVNEGEAVKIVYLGQEVSQKSKRPYHSFDLFHEKVAGETPTEEPVDADDIPF